MKKSATGRMQREPARAGRASGARQPVSGSRKPMLIGGIAVALMAAVALGAWAIPGGAKSAPVEQSSEEMLADTNSASVPAPDQAATTPAAAMERAPVMPVASAPVARATAGSAPAVGGSMVPVAKVVEQRFFAAGSSGATEFQAGIALANGDFLICGSTDDLEWTGTAPRTAWPATGIAGGGGERFAIVLHVAADLGSIKRVYHLPKGAAQGFQRVHGTGIPGGDPGTIYVSAGCTGLDLKLDGFVIMRLQGDAAGGALVPEWVAFVNAPGSKAGGFSGEGGYKKEPRWDVTNDGRVIAASGCEFDFDWAELRIIGANGQPTTLPGWTTKDGRSYLAMKAGSDAGLRSKTQEDFDLRQEDENGTPGRKGRWPDDYYFKAPGQGGPGYTGYKVSNKPSQRVGEFAIDRRDNHLYFGYSTQTRLPGGEPDFEPAIVAMDAEGRLKWWARGYKEIERTTDLKGNQDGINSPPDQYIDAVVIDYSSNRLVVGARCHGNGVINYWNGDKIVLNQGRPGFQKSFTGKNGNIHISWLGRYGLNDGKIYGATYMAELAEGTKVGPDQTTGLLAGWPSPNGGWPDVNTTRLAALAIDQAGRPLVAATGRRPYTTAGALIENVKPSQGKSAWAPFVRAYDQDLGDLAYSTILRGPWDKDTGASPDDSIELQAIVPLADGVLVLGNHVFGKKGELNSLPTTGVPAWGVAKPPGKTSSGIVAILRLPDVK